MASKDASPLPSMHTARTRGSAARVESVVGTTISVPMLEKRPRRLLQTPTHNDPNEEFVWRISFKIKIESVRYCTFSFFHLVAAFCLYIRDPKSF